LIRRRLLLAGAAMLGLGLPPAPARADGAFPDSMRVLLPPDRAQQILVGTNFGLLVSNDGGARWFLVCEEVIATGGENVIQYQLGPAPTHALYALSTNQLAVSTNDGCSWAGATGAWTDPFFTDVFPDASDDAHVFALAHVPSASGWRISSLFESHNGGRTFAAPGYEAGMGLLLTGVENAAAAPATIYLTAYGTLGDGVHSLLARSSDAGKSFREVSLLAALGAGEPRLAAVDPADPGVVYYRVLDRDGDRLAISRDGGETAQVALTLAGAMSAFLRREDGTLLVGTRSEGAFVSRDRGQTFVPWPEAPRLRALGERAGVLYAVADDAADGFALGASRDGGKTWRPLLRFESICGVLDCSPAVRATCQVPWSRLVERLGIRPACAGPTDDAAASAPGADAAVDAPGSALADGAAAPDSGARPGCDCACGGDPGPAALPGAALALLAVALGRRRGRGRRGDRAPRPRDRAAARTWVPRPGPWRARP
jgi:hypothetical protein